MINRNPTRILWFVLLIVTAILFTACVEAPGGFDLKPTSVGAYSIDPLFREFYDHLGGSDILGPAITPAFEYDGRRYQYVQAGCMEYDPNQPNSERFHLSPLGLEMNVQEPAVTPPTEPSELYVDGHNIYKGFVNLYRTLGGARFVGRPLTEVHFNPDKKRYEQYFENVGFFWLEGDTADSVRLLAYGSWKCAEFCQSLPQVANEVALPSLTTNAVTDLFAGIVSRLGPGLTGFPLTAPYMANDGMYEQIYESLVLAVDAQNQASISLRPLPEKIGILVEQPVIANGLEGMIFAPTVGDLGHNVPQAFLDFIVVHGGTEVSGAPIGELFMASDQIFRQCFKNYCLDYHMGTTIPDSLRIRPAALGYTYKELFYQPQDTSFTETQDLHEISLQVWEKHPFVTSTQSQEIGASLFEGANPLRNVEPVLTMTMPDGTEQTFYFPPTSLDGQTVKVLEPINAPNGTLIPYQVCISSLTGERFCVKESFVIWGNE